ncbi:hypothetical protein [Helicobacter pylori]|nr:hypothetical protein [Helicobacter pylori]
MAVVLGMLIPFLKYQLIIAQAIEWDKLEIKTQRLKSESSGDWQKEKDQTPTKKRVQKKEFKKRKRKASKETPKKEGSKREFHKGFNVSF